MEHSSTNVTKYELEIKMTKMKTTAALIILMAAAPMAAFAQPVSGSPEQSVAQDPDEKVEADAIFSTSNSFTTEPLYDSFDHADIVPEARGSIHADDAKRDN